MKVTSIKFITDNRIIDYEDAKDKYEVSDLVIVSSSQVEEIGRIIEKYEIKKDEKFKNENDNGEIVRKVNDEDKKKIKKNKKEAKEYIKKCEKKVQEHGLVMNIMDADLSFDGKKLTIYFSASKRVDFRSLVSDFVRSYKKLVRLQQVGPREQMKMMDWVGKCGQHICCSRFLESPEMVTSDCARNQNMSDVNTNKLNGICGKTMCCMKYEDEAYKCAKKNMPDVGDRVKTKHGIGKVIKQNVLKKTLFVKLEKNNERVEVKA